MLYSDFLVRDVRGNIIEKLKISKLCFGSLCMGPLQSRLFVREGAEVIGRAVSMGVNFIDTAQIYKTYPYIKAALEKTRERIFISTKTYAHTRELAARALDEALCGLGRDQIDIFLLHEQESIHTIRGHIEALEYLFRQKQEGVIKAVGISTHHVAGVWGAIEFNRTGGGYKLDVIHAMYNMAGLGIIPDKTKEGESAVSQMETALSEAKKNGFFIFSMKALGGGNLFSQAEKALGFSLSKPFIDSIAVGMKSGSEVLANVNFFETGKFNAEYYEDYKKTAEKKRLHIDGWCEGCGECVKICPAGALKILKNKAVCEQADCVLCGYCSGACGCFAIKII